ncbi:MAG TPA: hypothetical protein VFG74_05445 [Miltoncostaeaceae bacterium]|nr:hypothetical protein [Miltoncostaeaceae bacterium]
MTTRRGGTRGRRGRRRAGALAAALAAAGTVAAVVPAAASAAWADPQTICTTCSESDGLVSFAEAPNGAAVAAWHGNQATLVAYRGPKDDTFGTPFTVASGGKPEFVRAAIGADGTAAVSTWLPAVPNSQVIARRTPTAAAWTVLQAPDGGTNAHVAVGGDGSIVVAEWIVNPTTPSDQKLNAYRLPPNATAFSAATTLYSLATPFTSQQGIALAGNGEGQFVAAVTLSGGGATQTQATAAYSADGTAWQPVEKVGAAPSTLTALGVDPAGNALATYTGGAQPQSVFRSHFGDAWTSPTPVPAGAGRTMDFDQAGNAALLGTSGTGNDVWGYTVRNGGTGGYTASAPLGSPGGSAGLAVSPAGDALVVRSAGASLTSSWGSTLTGAALGNDDALPGSGARTLIGVGADQNSLGTAVWASAPASGLGSVFASTRAPGAGGTVTLSTSQLLTNQRISQAAVLRSNGALNALDAGLPATAFRFGAFGAAAFGPSVPVTGTVAPTTPSNARGYAVAIPKKSGSGGTVALTQEQLLINQRISQAAVLRSNAVRDRLDAGLTASQIGAGAISTPNLLRGLTFGALGANAPGTPITVPTASGGGGKVTLTAQQILINQRISQAAVRRSNLNIARLQAGLTQDQVAPAGIASQNVTPGVAP